MPRIYLSPPDVGPLEREYLLRAFDSGWIAPVGPDLDAFEREIAELTGWPGAVALSSGTAALHLALLVSGVRPGDDVMVSTFTFVATANAVVYGGANPIFIDSELATWNMSPQLLAEALTAARRRNRLPAAVIVVDLYGQCADYDEIVPMCHELGITVVEDAAEALGATYKRRPAGTLADIGVFSFNGNKIATTGGGGMLVTPSPSVADRVRYLATQARQPADHYEHTELGYNYRLSNVLAALGRAQLQRLPEMSAHRRALNHNYVERLCDVPGLQFMPVPRCNEWNGWLTCVVFDDQPTRDAVQLALAEADVESRTLWKPMHLQAAYASHDAAVDGTSERLFEHGLCLPSGSTLLDDDLDRVCSVVTSSLRSHR
jgi:dTDP-4-amino-4,6-dideoxygalactose transaminase